MLRVRDGKWMCMNAWARWAKCRVGGSARAGLGAAWVYGGPSLLPGSPRVPGSRARCPIRGGPPSIAQPATSTARAREPGCVELTYPQNPHLTSPHPGCRPASPDPRCSQPPASLACKSPSSLPGPRAACRGRVGARKERAAGSVGRRESCGGQRSRQTCRARQPCADQAHPAQPVLADPGWGRCALLDQSCKRIGWCSTVALEQWPPRPPPGACKVSHASHHLGMQPASICCTHLSVRSASSTAM